MLATIGIKVSSKKKLSNKQDFVSIAHRKESFLGEECNKLLFSHGKVLDYVARKYTLNNAHVAKAKMAWKSYPNVWDQLLMSIHALATKELPPLSDRKRRPSRVKTIAEAFVNVFTNAACHSGHATVYMYVLQCQVPKFIERYGDLLTYSCHGSEHLHAITKEAFKKETRKQPGKRLNKGWGAIHTNLHHHGDVPTPERKKRGSYNNKEAIAYAGSYGSDSIP
jgi:hypothetical protein